MILVKESEDDSSVSSDEDEDEDYDDFLEKLPALLSSSPAAAEIVTIGAPTSTKYISPMWPFTLEAYMARRRWP